MAAADEEREEQQPEGTDRSDDSRRLTEERRMRWAGVVLAAVALFAGGYAIGQATEDGPVASDRFDPEDELPPAIAQRLDRIEERLDRLDRQPGRRGPRGEGRFDLPQDFPCHIVEGEDGAFRFECDFDGDFRLPERFDDCPFFDGDCPWLHDDREQPDRGGDTDRAGFLGVGVVDDEAGVLVTSVVAGSPAGDAGIESGDVIVRFDGTMVESAEELADLIAAAGAGASVEVTLLRSGSEVELVVELSGRPG